MPALVVVLPAIAGFAAAEIGIVITGMVLLDAVIVGAVAGAVVGGLTAAVTGGDIGEGILFGAVGGAVGGALAGMYDLNMFSSIGLGKGGGDAALVGAGETLPAGGAEGGLAGGSAYDASYITPQISSDMTGVTTTGLKAGADVGAAAGMSDMTKYALLSGGAQMFSSATAKTPYATSEQGTKEQLASNEKNTQMTLEQRQREAEMNAILTREKYALDESSLTKNIAQRNVELMTPYDQAAASRGRATETATGLTLQRKQAEAAMQNQNMIQEDINNYIAAA